MRREAGGGRREAREEGEEARVSDNKLARGKGRGALSLYYISK